MIIKVNEVVIKLDNLLFGENGNGSKQKGQQRANMKRERQAVLGLLLCRAACESMEWKKVGSE